MVAFDRILSQVRNQSGEAGDKSYCSNITAGSLAVSVSVKWSAMDRRVVESEGFIYVECSRAKRDVSVRKNGVGASLGCDNGMAKGVSSGFLPILESVFRPSDDKKGHT